MTKLKQFNYNIRGCDFYGICEIQTIENLPVIVSLSDLYLDGYTDSNPWDMQHVVDYQIILDIEDMVRVEYENSLGGEWK